MDKLSENKNPYSDLINELFEPIEGKAYYFGLLPLKGYYVYRGSVGDRVGFHVFTQAGYSFAEIKTISRQMIAQENRQMLGIDPKLNLPLTDRVLAVELIITDPVTDPTHKVFEQYGLKLVE